MLTALAAFLDIRCAGYCDESILAHLAVVFRLCSCEMVLGVQGPGGFRTNCCCVTAV